MSSPQQDPNAVTPPVTPPITPPVATTATANKGGIDPVVSIYVFTGITLVYFILKYLMPQRESVLFIVYFLLVLSSQFGLNIYLAKQMCNSPSNVGTAALATFMPWIFIFGVLNLLLSVFPGWLSAFSNTIGYAIASVAGVASFFTDQLLNVNVGNTSSKDAFKVIQNVTNDPSTIINTINDENVENFWNKQKEIEEFNEYYKLLKHSQAPAPINSASTNSHSLYSIYQSYCKYAFDKGYNIISKRWFEKYFISKYGIFLIDNAIISSKWFQL